MCVISELRAGFARHQLPHAEDSTGAICEGKSTLVLGRFHESIRKDMGK